MKTLLFSVTINDCIVEAFRASGPGGQNRNKVSSAIRITHPPSGAVGIGKDFRDQFANKKSAFKRMAESKEFKAWHTMETARLMGKLDHVKEQVEEMMKPENLKIEYYTPES